MTLSIGTSHPFFPEIAGYAIVEPLYFGTRTAVYRAIQATQQRPVVIKLLRRDYPTFAELVQFRHQYTIAKHLALPGIVQPLSLEPWGHNYILVMEDWDGVSLGQYVRQQSLNLADVFAIALQLADILHDLAQHRVVHKDIKPANILIHPESKQVKLIDFSIASLLPKETQGFQSPSVLEGTLAYLAPEQTGRMNRGIDYRADFYALGVTLYQLLTGALPFVADDPLELIHCHIAKQPTPVHRVNPEVPAMVAAIVTKLMAKNAEDRYQSAMGLKHDLEQCFVQWKATGSIAGFELGQRDLSDRLSIPEKLYGRQAEVKMLLDAFDRVALGSSELMLVAGFSGIGKTAVVNEVHKPIVRQRGYFIKGKFDQFSRNIPLSAFAQALRDLMRQVLSESDRQLEQWKTQILSAVGENGQILIEVIPELEQIIGQQPTALDLSGTAAQNRFNLLFQKFIEVFTTAEHPLVIFLDDLQWADLASLQLIKLLMNDSGYLLMLGAYRDNEVSPVHPFNLMVEDLKQSAAIVHTIALCPLAIDDTNHLISDTLACSIELAQPLTELIDRKTRGNPFFITQFLKALYEDGHIVFDQHQYCWQCDIAQVNALALTDDVVEFMAWQLQKLPAATQQVLKLAACVGNQFDLETLAIVSEQSPTHTAASLWPALKEGLILPTSQIYKFFQSSEQPGQLATANPTYRFLHDRIQQAAYFLIPESLKEETHLKIGQLLLQEIPEIQQNGYIFEIVNHLNLAVNLLYSLTEQENLAKLNLTAGHKAKISIAYETSLQYFQAGIKLLAVDCWHSQYNLALELYLEAAESSYLCQRFELTQYLTEQVLLRSKAILDKIRAYEIQILSSISQGSLLNAIEIGKHALQLLDIQLPQTPTEEDFQVGVQEISNYIKGKNVSDFLTLPLLEDVTIQSTLRILSRLYAPTYIALPALMPIIVLRMVCLSMQYGNVAESTFAYCLYGLILCNVLGDTNSGYQFGNLALDLLKKINAKEYEAKVLHIYAVFIQHRYEHLERTIPLLVESYIRGLETGDREFASYSALNYGCNSFWLGAELENLAAEISVYSHSVGQMGQPSIQAYLHLHQQVVINLLGRSQNPCRLVGSVYNEDDMLILYHETNDLTGIGFLLTCKLILNYLFGEITQAIDYAAQAEAYLQALPGFAHVPLLFFYRSLALLDRQTNQLNLTKNDWLTQVQESQALVKQRADEAPMNFLHKWQLIEAERQAILGNRVEAVELYDRAIAGAKENRYIQEEALANELAAKFYLDWGKEKVAAGYMQEAYYCYAQWGAKAKTNYLEQNYPNLLRPILQSSTQSVTFLETLATITTPHVSTHTPISSSYSSSRNINSILDFAAILKAAQSLASSIHLSELLHQLTQIILQNSGGDRCALIRPNATGEWYVDAIASLQTTELCSVPLDGNKNFPVKLIQYVRNTQEVVVIDALQTDLAVIDEYLLREQPQSIVCLPIVNQGQLIGILSLENRTTRGVFTSDRVLALDFLCTQAAISLENARLYQESQTHSQQLEASLEKLRLSETRFQKLADNVPGLIYQIWIQADGSSSMSYVSSGCQALYEVAAEDLLSGKYSLRDFEHPDDQETVFQAVIESAQNLTPFRAEWRIVTPTGNVKWVKAASQPERWEDGKIVWDGILIDITDLKRAEASVLQSSQELEQALAELQNTQLQMIQGEKMASLGNLVAGVAHEINNPIGFLNGSIKNAEDYIQDLLAHLVLYQQHHPNAATPVQEHADEIDLEFLREDLPKLLDSMQAATDRIKSISTSLRTFSRADTDYKVSTNLHDGIDSTLLILKYRLKASDLRPAIVVVKEYGELPLIDCFPSQLNQVFMNILANAIDMFDEVAQQTSFAALQGAPQKITIQTTVPDPTMVEIRISDNGKGISTEVKAKIFDHLFTTKGIGKGTGLGLAIARQIVEEKHGGSLDVLSTLGQGTAFCIRLPINGE